MCVRYLNTDCILRSDSSLAAAMNFLLPHIFVLWDEAGDDGSSVGIETNLTNSKGPEEDILEFIRLFEMLTPPLRQLLNGCNEKKFDIGFEGGNTGDALDVALHATTIRKIYEFGFSLHIRIYPPGQEALGQAPAS